MKVWNGKLVNFVKDTPSSYAFDIRPDKPNILVNVSIPARVARKGQNIWNSESNTISIFHGEPNHTSFLWHIYT